MRTPLLISALAVSVALAAGLRAQTATDANLGATLVVNASTPTHTFSWWGTSGFHYIVETSTDLLSPWVSIADYNPSGADAPISVAFDTSAPRMFFRVFQIDPADLTATTDADGDGLADKWEQFFFSGLSLSAADDPEPDGFSNAEEFVAGTKPNQAPDASSAAILSLSVWTPFR
jgi:hypothetical protein